MSTRNSKKGKGGKRKPNRPKPGTHLATGIVGKQGNVRKGATGR